ncbi:MAG: UDP-glucose/GDP-mannose dehydrogenase family protein [Chloroflexi bacterium]|nr:UDP-glucose/GDP-mannose dehydrogenase family protein [Chloroflexota bacterium]
MKVVVVGVGYVGLVTAVGLAALGNEIVGLDVDESKVERLNRGESPIYEPGLSELLDQQIEARRLTFSTSYADTVATADFVFIAVNTPQGPSGETDLRWLRAAVTSLCPYLTDGTVVVNKSTVPIGTADTVESLIAAHCGETSIQVVSNPEFLREGSAVHDFFNPDRIVLGATDSAAAERVAQLYTSFTCPVIITDRRTAEMVKYGSNAFLATKISFINEMAAICERVGADVKVVAEGMGYDHRIGRAFLNAGLGYGGSCFPKDLSALEHLATVHGCHPQLLRSVMEINRDQRLTVIRRLRQILGSLEGRRIGLLGLAFKPNTDDLRNAAAFDLIHLLRYEGCHVAAYDPVAIPAASKLASDVEYCDDPYAVAQNADALVLVTEWNEFTGLDLLRLRDAMRSRVIIDGRNVFEPAEMIGLGFLYFGIGRGTYPTSPATTRRSTPRRRAYERSDAPAAAVAEPTAAGSLTAEVVPSPAPESALTPAVATGATKAHANGHGAPAALAGTEPVVLG